MLGRLNTSASPSRKLASDALIYPEGQTTKWHVRPCRAPTLSTKRSLLTVLIWSVHPPIVPTLKMAVWLCLPCAGGPNSGRKSDAQRPFPRIRDAQSHVCLNYSNSCLHTKKTTKHPCTQYVARHLATKQKIFLFYPVCSGAYSFSGYVTRPSTQTDHIVSHGSAALNDRCLFSVLFRCLTRIRRDRRAAVTSIQ